VPGQGSAEGGVGEDGGVTDTVDRIQRVPHPDRMQCPPPVVGQHPGVDLQVQVAVRVAGTGGVVPDGHCLELLDRDLHLATARADAGRRVLGQPRDDLLGGAVLRRVIGDGDLGVQFGGDRPRLRPVHGHFDKAHRAIVVTQPAPRLPGVRVDPGHPRLVPVAGHRVQLEDMTVRAGVNRRALPVPSAK
jgi:hypothetical protein